MTSLVFPGQGSQYLGMSKDFYDNFSIFRDTIDEIENISSINVKKIIFENSNNYLNITKYTQVCIFSVSIGIYKILKNVLDEKNIKINFLLGHSLGEYSALVASDVISISDCAKLLKIRGELMQNAFTANKSGMAAVIGLNCNTLENIISNNNIELDIANDNSPIQVVLSGTNENLSKAENLILSNGAKKFIKLNVSAAFHSKIMNNAQEKMLSFLESITFNNPIYPIISNYSAEVSDNSEKIFTNLSKQMANKVRWVESINRLSAFEEKKIIEIGPGKVLSGLIKRISNDFKIDNIDNIIDLESYVNGL